MGTLDGKTIAILAADGFEQVELTEPRKAIEDAGGTTEVISLQEGEILGFDHLEHGDKLAVDKAVKDASADDYDGLLIPGGVINGDFLRADADAVRFVASFAQTGSRSPRSATDRGFWSRPASSRAARITSWPSLQTDVENAGGTWVDEEVHVDAGARHEPQARRHPGLQREGDRGIRRGRPRGCAAARGRDGVGATPQAQGPAAPAVAPGRIGTYCRGCARSIWTGSVSFGLVTVP